MLCCYVTEDNYSTLHNALALISVLQIFCFLHYSKRLLPKFQYMTRLFGRIKEHKQKNNVKYLWTSNGKIMLKVNETYTTEAFTTHEKFEDYLDQISNRE